jgi:cyclic beta-1,2-glucan synthetase
VEVTTYAEVALHEPPAHDGHPAFSRLFVRTEYEPAAGALLFRRRPRGEGESFPWLVHALAGPGRPLAWETDRARFLGRGRDASAPRAVCGPEPLSGATGDVLDPVMALRVELALAAGEEAERVFLLGADASRAGALELARVVADGAEAAGVFADAARAEEARLGRLGLSLQAAGELETLAGAILYGEPAVRPDGSLRPSIAALRAEPGVVRPSRVSFAPRRAFVTDRPRSAAARADLRAAAGYWDVLGLPIDLVQRGTGGALSIHPVAPADALADPAERPERRS